MHLVVGLGNPGTAYGDTPHNAGFRVCDLLADRHHLGSEQRKFKGLLRRGRMRGLEVAILKPQTFMNLSGESVAQALRYLPVELDELLVVYDEMDLEVGRLRIRPDGGHGGHNGMRSVIDHLGTRDFVRLRIGIGRPPEGKDPTAHLLSRVRSEERVRFEKTVHRAAEAVESILFEGVEKAMNRFNGPAPDLADGRDEEERS